MVVTFATLPSSPWLVSDRGVCCFCLCLTCSKTEKFKLPLGRRKIFQALDWGVDM